MNSPQAIARPVTAHITDKADKKVRTAVLAWVVVAVYYFYQYVLRSAPSVMMPQLSQAFGISALAVASMAGLFYYGYSPFSLIAGAAMDRLGPRGVLPIGAAMVGVGALLFSIDSRGVASFGRLLQGAGGVFALVGAIYIATKYFPASQAATLIGATQMFGMAGGALGQFGVGPLMSTGLPWNRFWMAMGVVGLLMAALLIFLLPKQESRPQPENWLKTATLALFIVFKNPQSILCGLISGLLFIPTTIFDMTWGVRYLQEGHNFDFASAVMRSATVPFGWIIGCPLLGFISDRIERRKPVIVGGALILLICLACILFRRPETLPPYVIGLVAGVASGSAMLPYVVIKEANPPEFGGTATGVINFLNFSFSALLGPVFAGLLQYVSSSAPKRELEHYQAAFLPLLFGVAAAIVLTFLVKETGPAARQYSYKNKQVFK